MTLMEPPTETTGPPPVLLASYPHYKEAQHAVDRLSDEGFPVSKVSIVWSGLRQIEDVTGRRTAITAAAEGALSGAWFGLLIGLLFSAFADPSESALGIVVTYVIVGAIGVAVWRAIAHVAQRGTRDFSTTRRIDAEEYQLWVAPGAVAEATAIIGVGTTRPVDPEPDLELDD